MKFEPIARFNLDNPKEPTYWNRTFEKYPDSIWKILDIYEKTGILVINPALSDCYLVYKDDSSQWASVPLQEI